MAPPFENAKVSDAMHLGVDSCAPEASLAELARTLATHHIHCVIVNRQQPFKPARSQPSGTDVSASSSCFLAA